MDRFILSDESVNCYGFRLLTKGANIKDFQKNPVMLLMHLRGMVIGRWDDIQVSKEDANITALPVFDLTDPVAAGIASKVEQKMMNATSVGAEPVEWSDKPELLLPGQTRPTVTRWNLNEASMVDIPGNKGALRLNLGNGLWLTDDTNANAQLLDKALPLLTLKSATQMDEILLALGLAAGSTEAQAVAAIKKMKTDGATAQADALISLAEKAGLVTAENKDQFVELAKVAPHLAIKFLPTVSLAAPTAAPAPAAPVVVPPASVPARPTTTLAAEVQKANAQNGNAENGVTLKGREGWNLRKWETEDPNAVKLMRKNEPEKYQALYDEFYGKSL